MAEAATESLGRIRPTKKLWATTHQMCDKRRRLKSGKGSKNEARKYREINHKIKKEMKEAMQEWTGEQCREIEE